MGGYHYGNTAKAIMYENRRKSEAVALYERQKKYKEKLKEKEKENEKS